MSIFCDIHDIHPADPVWKAEKYNIEILICSAIAARLCADGVSKNSIIDAFIAANENDTSFADEVVVSTNVQEVDLYRVIAAEFGLEFTDQMISSRILLRIDDVPQKLRSIRHALVDAGGVNSLLYIAPTMSDLVVLRRYLIKFPELIKRIRICPPSILTDGMGQRLQRDVMQLAQEMTPQDFSAFYVINGWQAFLSVAVLFVYVMLLKLYPTWSMLALHIGFSVFFFGCVIIRLLAARSAQPLHDLPIKSFLPKHMPIYTILVPLYKEAAIIGQLLQALSRLRWPVSKLDIKLICETDDTETIAAIAKHKLLPCFEIIKIPLGGPRTKPKALNYALQFARGDFVVVYDAEDKPHPDQLLEAWQVFEGRDKRLACLQAPLIIENINVNWLTRMFAFEYAALFRGLLPWFARSNFVVPLGGTSNHLRRECLETVGGWGCHNVTEDADLGVRLARFGYQVGIISRGTWEDAPADHSIWRKQRTRWFKGWIQTLLIHMRNPVRTCRELGFVPFIINNIYMIGLVLSALIHPMMVITITISLTLFLARPETDVAYAYLLGFDVTNVLLSYLSYFVLILKTLEPEERKADWFLLYIPVYWMLMSVSVWRAIAQLFSAPHLWEKTPHYPSAQFTSTRAAREPLTEDCAIDFLPSSKINPTNGV